MIELIKSKFPKQYQHYAEGVDQCAPYHPELSALLNSDVLRQAISQYSVQQGVNQSKTRALASVWHMHYLLRILPVIVVAQSVCHLQLPLGMAECQLDLKHWRLLLKPSLVKPFADASAVDYHNLLELHLLPLHDYLQQAFGISAKVLWSNTMFRLQGSMQTAAQLRPQAQVLQHFERIRYTNPGNGHPMPYQRANSGQASSTNTSALRSHCCLLHEIPQQSYCFDCPKSPENMTLRAN